jgi:hypothetical protein
VHFLSDIARNVTVPYKRANLFLLGPSQCGKTSVLANLIKKKSLLSKAEKFAPTQGLAQSSWVFECKDVKDKLTLTTWDFSGNGK